MVNTNTVVDYLKGIAENNYAILQRIYQESLPKVDKYIQENSGSLEDSKDVFQEAILIIYKKVKTNNLQLTTTFHAYLFSVCKNLWLKKLRNKRNYNALLSLSLDLKIDTKYEEDFLISRKWQLFNEKFQALKKECRMVLQLFFNGKSGKEIATIMGYTEEYAKRKKYKCKLSLAELIKKDPIYQALIQQ